MLSAVVVGSQRYVGQMWATKLLRAEPRTASRWTRRDRESSRMPSRETWIEVPATPHLLWERPSLHFDLLESVLLPRESRRLLANPLEGC